MAPIAISEVLTAIVLHQLLMRIELDRFPLRILGLTICSSLIQTLIAHDQTSRLGLFAISWSAFFRVIIYLTINILAYRSFFHPLRQFPGPYGAKFSKLWALRRVIQSKIRWYKVIDELRTEYGDVVRIGPRELVFLNADAITPILGPSSKATRGPFYGALELSILSTRSQTFHKQRRKSWDLVLKTTLADCDTRIEQFTHTLLTRVESSVSQKIVLNDLCVHYAFDAMSSLGFGEDSKFLIGEASPHSRRILARMQESIVAMGPLSHVPWLVTVFRLLLRLFRADMMAEPSAKQSRSDRTTPNIIDSLREGMDDTLSDKQLLRGDSRIILSAGSDTTAIALTIIFVLLACYPDYQTQLRKEMETYLASGAYKCTQSYPLLDSIINEALRLYPPVTFSSQRVTPREGMSIDGIFIPGDTIISVATWQLHHDPRNFLQPNDFIPERWTSRLELVLNKAAFIPFSTGPYNCPGKGLAMMELRSVVARTIEKYEVRMADENFDERTFHDGILDHFTAGVPRCEVVFQRR